MKLEKTVSIKSSRGSYNIKIFPDFNFLTKELLNVWSGGKIVIITDAIVGKLYLNQLREILYEIVKEVYPIIVESGERSKSFGTLQMVFAQLIEKRINSSDLIISLGGGVVGDLGGYVASTFLSGIPYIQIPTTLLAQIDSSIGGKTAINFNGLKNIVGAFYNPRLVYINTKVLNSLSEREYRCGIAEAMVHALIAEKELVYFIHNNAFGSCRISNELIPQFIYRNCVIKSSIVKRDEIDNGSREILNFGHTFGHAFESLYEYKYKHGECVSVGIASAFKIAFYNNLISKDKYEEILQILQDIGLPTKLCNINWDKVVDIIRFDKKQSNNKIRLILPSEIGEVVTHIFNFSEFKDMVLAIFKE